jgi:hypothetical protein
MCELVRHKGEILGIPVYRIGRRVGRLWENAFEEGGKTIKVEVMLVQGGDGWVVVMLDINKTMIGRVGVVIRYVLQVRHENRAVRHVYANLKMSVIDSITDGKRQCEAVVNTDEAKSAVNPVGRTRVGFHIVGKVGENDAHKVPEITGANWSGKVWSRELHGKREDGVVNPYAKGKGCGNTNAAGGAHANLT